MRIHPHPHPYLRYRAFVRRVAREAQVSFETVKAVIAAMVPALMTLKENESLRTPLGSFWMGVRNERWYTTPRTGQRVLAPATHFIKFKANSKLKKTELKTEED